MSFVVYFIFAASINLNDNCVYNVIVCFILFLSSYYRYFFFLIYIYNWVTVTTQFQLWINKV